MSQDLSSAAVVIGALRVKASGAAHTHASLRMFFSRSVLG